MKAPRLRMNRDGNNSMEIVISWILGPLAWAAHLAASYAISGWVCETGRFGILHLLSFSAIALALAGTALGWRLWSASGRSEPRRFMGAGAMGLSIFSVAAIIAGSMPGLILTNCNVAGVS